MLCWNGIDRSMKMKVTSRALDKKLTVNNSQKKKKKLMEQAHELFYSKGASLGTRKIMLDYVWEYCVKPQLGYSFS